MTKTPILNPQFLQSIIREKSCVVVENIFQEKTAENITALHKQLQDVIKNKNNQLKKIFYSKYTQMINCSALLNNIRGFSRSIAEVGRQISTHSLKNNKQQAKELPETGLSPRLLRKQISRLTERLQFKEAMELTLASLPRQIDSSDKHLMEVVLLDLLDAISSSLMSNTLLDFSMLKEIVMAVSQFLQYYSRTTDSISIADQYGAKTSTLLKLKKRDLSPFESAVCTIKNLFELKVSRLASNMGHHDLKRIISDLTTISTFAQECLGQDRFIQNTNTADDRMNFKKEITDMYRQGFKSMHRQLAQAMILCDKNTISFNYSFFQSLQADQQLIQRFNSLGTFFGVNEDFSMILSSMWDDFFIQITRSLLKDFNFMEWSILSLIKNSNTCSIKNKGLRVNRQHREVINQLDSQSQILEANLKQISQLIQKSQPDKKEKSRAIFVSELDLVWRQLQNKLLGQEHRNIYTFLTQSPDYVGYIALSLIAQRQKQLYIDLQQIVPEATSLANVQQKIEQSLRQLNRQMGSTLLQYLLKSKEYDVECVVQTIEETTMQFLNAINSKKSQPQCYQILKKVTLNILKQLGSKVSGKDKSRIEYTIRKLTSSEQEISIHTSLLHFLPKSLFGASSVPEIFNISLYQDVAMSETLNKRNLTSRLSKDVQNETNKPTSPNNPVVIESKQLFDIGETKEQMMKLATKSIYGFSNSLAGLLSRISN